MSQHARPTKQFSFIGKNFGILSRTQRSLLRRTNYYGGTFNDGVGAQSAEESRLMQDGRSSAAVHGVVEQVPEIVVDWSEADGIELNGPTFLTLNQEGMDILRFKVTDDHHFEFYSNTRNYLDVIGKIEKV